jgi:hypothetical protein
MAMTNTTTRSLILALGILAIAAWKLPPASAAQGKVTIYDTINRVDIIARDIRPLNSPIPEFTPGAYAKGNEVNSTLWWITPSETTERHDPWRFPRTSSFAPLLSVSWLMWPGAAPVIATFPFAPYSQQDNFELRISATAGGNIDACQNGCTVPVTTRFVALCTSADRCPDITLSTSGPVISGQTATYTVTVDGPPAAKKKK